MIRYQWESCPCPDTQLLHVDRQLPSACVNLGAGASGIADDEDAAFFAALLEIPGVATVHTLDYRCIVIKGRLFGWGDIRPAIVEVFRRHFAPTGAAVEVGGGRPPDVAGVLGRQGPITGDGAA